MNSRFTTVATVAAATSILAAGYRAGAFPEIHKTSTIEAERALGEAPADISADMGMDPATLPSSVMELNENGAHSEGLNTVAQLNWENDELTFVPTPGLEEKYSDIFKAALTDSDILINAAVKRGNLDRIMFVVGLPAEELSASSRFIETDKALAVNISDKGMSYDELRAGLRHGLWSSLTAGVDFSDDETSRQVAEACDEIDENYLPDSLQYVGTVVEELIELYNTNRKTHPRAYKHKIAALRSVERYLRTGQGATEINQYCGRLSVVGSVRQLEDAAAKEKLQRLDKPRIITSMPDGLLEQVINTPIREDLTKTVVMSPAFVVADESMYAQGPSMGTENLGRKVGPDNPAACIASLLNEVTDNTSELAGNTAGLLPAERRIIFAVLDLAVRKTSEANPDLAEMLVAAEDNLQRRVAKSFARQQSVAPQ